MSGYFGERERGSHQFIPSAPLLTSEDVVPPQPPAERIEIFRRRRIVRQSRQLGNGTDGRSDSDGEAEVTDAEAVELVARMDVVLLLEEVGKAAKVGALLPPEVVTGREGAEKVGRWLVGERGFVGFDIVGGGILVKLVVVVLGRRSENNPCGLGVNGFRMLVNALEDLIEVVGPGGL